MIKINLLKGEDSNQLAKGFIERKQSHIQTYRKWQSDLLRNGIQLNAPPRGQRWEDRLPIGTEIPLSIYNTRSQIRMFLSALRSLDTSRFRGPLGKKELDYLEEADLIQIGSIKRCDDEKGFIYESREIFKHLLLKIDPRVLYEDLMKIEQQAEMV